LGADVSYLGSILPLPLDLKRIDHDRLDLELRLTPLSPGALGVINSLVIGDANAYPKRLLIADAPAEHVSVLFTHATPTLVAAAFAAESLAPDGQPLRLERVFTLLPGRGVWVRDRFVHLGDAPLHVGPVWHFAAAQAESAEWIRSPGLRVGFAPSADAESTLSHLRRFGLHTPFAFAQGGALAPGATASRDSFLVPEGSAPGTWTVSGDTLLIDGQAVATLVMQNSSPVSVEAVAP
jgi:hypothetical protein